MIISRHFPRHFPCPSPLTVRGAHGFRLTDIVISVHSVQSSTYIRAPEIHGACYPFPLRPPSHHPLFHRRRQRPHHHYYRRRKHLRTTTAWDLDGAGTRNHILALVCSQPRRTSMRQPRLPAHRRLLLRYPRDVLVHRICHRPASRYLRVAGGVMPTQLKDAVKHQRSNHSSHKPFVCVPTNGNVW